MSNPAPSGELEKRNLVRWCVVHYPEELIDCCPACEAVHLSDQLAAERAHVAALQRLEATLQEQLADERAWREQMIDQLEIERKRTAAAVEALTI